jgi:hypothetical protein
MSKDLPKELTPKQILLTLMLLSSVMFLLIYLGKGMQMIQHQRAELLNINWLRPAPLFSLLRSFCSSSPPIHQHCHKPSC